MIFKEALPFIEEFLNEVNATLGQIDRDARLSLLQKRWISFCLMGILVTNKICWSKFFRASLGQYNISALCWMLRHSKILWNKLLMASILTIFNKFKIQSGVLVIDDTDKQRSKRTRRIHKAHKIFDKSTSGYFNGQNIVFLLLVSNKITIPVGFDFYLPDPEIKKWEKEDSRLKELGISKNNRPAYPERNPHYPNKIDIAVKLVDTFKKWFPIFTVKAIIADAFYGNNNFAERIESLFPCTQIISQLRSNQLVKHYHNFIPLSEYFRRCPGVKHIITIRGGAPIKVTMHGARLFVDAHGVKRYLVALKYDGECDYRYIFATDLAWRMEDIVQTYSLRWLVEVFFQDWKGNEGWGELKLLDDEGSERAVILSLIFDYSLLFHPTQLRLIDNKLPVCTIGSLLRRCRIDAFLQYLKNILNSSDPIVVVNNLETSIAEIYELRPSSKHMSGQDLGRIGPTKQLLHRRKNKNAA